MGQGCLPGAPVNSRPTVLAGAYRAVNRHLADHQRIGGVILALSVGWEGKALYDEAFGGFDIEGEGLNHRPPLPWRGPERPVCHQPNARRDQRWGW